MKFTPLEVKEILLYVIQGKKDGKWYICSTNISNGAHKETRREKINQASGRFLLRELMEGWVDYLEKKNPGVRMQNLEGE